ncbi:MAG: carboxymuconolactone decarboxylase family protein [Myxococcota bacterium]
MRLAEPRLEPLALEDIAPEVRERIGESPLNIFRTLAHHPGLMKRWLVFGNHVLAKSSLAPRERELVILRVGWLCRAGYEWGQHVVIGKASGLGDEEIARIPDGPEADGWDAFDAALLRAADELHEDAFISDATWQALSQRLDTEQLLDLIFTIGQYHLVSMALNSLGVQLDEGIEGLPAR